MLEQLIQSKVTANFVPYFLLAIAIEMVVIRVFAVKGTKDLKDDGVSVFMGLMSVITNGLTAFLTVSVLFWAAQYGLFDIPITVTALLLCFFIDDLRYYLHHRIAHRCRWVWAMHYIHHSSNRYSLAVALRQGWTKHFTGTMMLKLPIVLLGFDPFMVIFCGAVNAIYQFFLHTESIGKLPRWFEFIFNTPSHHRVHHGRNPQYLDANYAGTLIIWDRMFGTFVEEQEEVDFGLVAPMTTYNPLRIAFGEYWRVIQDFFMSGLTFKQRLAYVFAPPGWSHDGSRQSSHDIKRAAGLYPAKQASEQASENASEQASAAE